MCIRQMGTARLAIVSMFLSRVPGVMSFIRFAPADIATLATADLYVSMVIRVLIPASRRGSIAGLLLLVPLLCLLALCLGECCIRLSLVGVGLKGRARGCLEREIQMCGELG